MMRSTRLIGFVMLCLSLHACSGDTESDEQAPVRKAEKPMVIIDRESAQFVQQAASTALYEINIDKLAVSKGSDKRVKNFGNIMAKEHLKAITKLTAIANSKKIPVPQTMTVEEQDEINALLKNDGKAFDHAYMAAMEKNHENAIKLFTHASKQLMDPELRNFAAKNIGNLQRHLDVVHMIQSTFK
jgi:putative membrane protein